MANESQITYRPTTAADADAVLAFYAEMIDVMAGTDFDVLWKHDEHPSHAFLEESTAKGQAIIGTLPDGTIASALVIDHEPAPGYEQVPWQVPGRPEEIGIVHVVATLPQYHGRGFARGLMNAAIGLSRERGLKALRLDTFLDNNRSQGLYGSLGFIDHGAWPVFYDDLGTVDLKMYEYPL